MKQTCILVLGMHRSGTSALTGVLQHIDIDLGSKLLESMADNQKGFFENSYIVNFNEKILKKLGSSWDDIFFDYNAKQGLINYEDREELKALLLREFGTSTLFAIKDPRICYLFPLYATILEEMNINIKILLPYRNPLEVAKSLEKRNNFTLEKSVALWLNYFLYAEFYSRKYERFFLKFDELITNTKNIFKEVDKYLKTQLYERFLIQKKQIEDFLESDLKHNNIDKLILQSGIKFILEDFLSIYEQDINLVDVKLFDKMKYKNDECKLLYISFFNELTNELYHLKDELYHLKDELKNTKNKLLKTELDNKRLNQVLTKVYTSKSWKITKPLRDISSKIRLYFNQ